MLCGAHKSNVKQERGAQDDLGNAHPPKCIITPTTNTLGPYNTPLQMNSIQSLEGGHSVWVWLMSTHRWHSSCS